MELSLLLKAGDTCTLDVYYYITPPSSLTPRWCCNRRPVAANNIFLQQGSYIFIARITFSGQRHNQIKPAAASPPYIMSCGPYDDRLLPCGPHKVTQSPAVRQVVIQIRPPKNDKLSRVPGSSERRAQSPEAAWWWLNARRKMKCHQQDVDETSRWF